MQKESYFATVFKRRNILKELVLGVFLGFSSYPKLVMEVFIRKNMGERYFSLATVITIAVILYILPTGLGPYIGSISYGGHYSYRPSGETSGRYVTWYLFITAFVLFGFIRWFEIRRNPSVFDFARFSLSGGQLLLKPIFLKYWPFEAKPNIRTMEIYLEPLVFFIPGLLLWTIGQPLGELLVICSIFYCLGTAGSYYSGDHFLMDKIDEMICQEDLATTFVDGTEPISERGFKWFGPDIKDPNNRQKVYEAFMGEEDSFSEAI